MTDSKKKHTKSEPKEEEEVYEVEKIMSHRLSKRFPNTLEYLIKWKNYDEKSNTWENERNIYSEDLLQDYWKGQKREAPPTDETPAKDKRQKRGDRTKHLNVLDSPPEGLTWADAERISHIYSYEKSNLFAKIHWKNGKTSISRTSLLRENIPGILIDFYEQHLSFKGVNGAE